MTRQLAFVDDEALALRFRSRLLSQADKKVLIAKLSDSISEQDKYTITNCGGYGRIREFKDYRLYLETAVFPDRPLRPNFRGYPPSDIVRTQVFQLAACNWRCWYCFVDDNRLSANRRTSQYLSAVEMVDLYLNEPNRPDILDLSGGQPDLVPEWTLWIAKECERRSLLDNIYIWVDDNLSNDFLFRYLSSRDVDYLANIPSFSRMGCFKGFDGESFSFSTLVEPKRFDEQFHAARRMIEAGFRFYAYATFTTPNAVGLDDKMRVFIDRLQGVHELLPLWTTPLKIFPFAVTTARLDSERKLSLSNQLTAFEAWDEELHRRFPSEMLLLRPDQVRE